MIKREFAEKNNNFTEIEWQAESPAERAGLEIVRSIKQAGGEAYFVGGYVRDLVIQKKFQDKYPDASFDPADVDIASNFDFGKINDALASSQTFKLVNLKYTGANNKIPTYVATVELGGQQINIDVASYRLDGDYDEETRDCQCEIAETLEEDAARRDFTINGLYFDPETGLVIDPVGGLADLKEKKLCFIGDANHRINDDPLRILRYVRFRNKIGLNFDQQTKADIINNLDKLDKIKKERLANNEKGELNKIMQLPRAAFAIADLGRLGVLRKILPEVYQLFKTQHNPEDEDELEVHLEGDVYRHTLEVMRSINRTEFINLIKESNELPQETTDNQALNFFLHKYGCAFNWGALLHDIGKPAKQQEGERNHRKVFSFIGHAEESSAMLSEVAGRVGMHDELRHKVDFLISHHMAANGMIDSAKQISQHGFGPNQKKILRSRSLIDCQALLYLSLADNLGTFTQKEKHDLSENFRLVWQKLSEFKANEGNAEKIKANKKVLGQLVMEFFPQAAGNDYMALIIKALQNKIEVTPGYLDERGLLIENEVRQLMQSIGDLGVQVNFLRFQEKMSEDQKTFLLRRINYQGDKTTASERIIKDAIKKVNEQQLQIYEQELRKKLALV